LMPTVRCRARSQLTRTAASKLSLTVLVAEMHLAPSVREQPYATILNPIL
jgi:hypothetical protein